MAEQKKKRKSGEGEMSFLEHLEELRWHIIRSVVAIVVLMIVAFVFKNIIFDKIILAPKEPAFLTNRLLCQLGQLVHIDALCINTKPVNLISIKMAGQITTHITVALVAGLILAFPYILWEFWQFFKPALHPNERKHARGGVLAASLLFFAGVLFGYYVIVPLSVHFLGSYSVSEQVENQINLISYISTVSSVTLATGVIFELPILIFFLTKVGVVTPEFLRQYRKHAIILILVLAAIITPPDIFSQVLVCFPLIGLYEISILISGRVLRKQEARMKEDE